MIMQKITISKIFLFLFFITFITFINLANAAESKNMNNKNQTQIQFAVIASENAKNDSIKAKVFAEDTANSTAELAKEINKKIETLINFAKNKSPTKLKINSGQQISYPIYSKNNKNIERWKMRSELIVEAKSENITALSEFLGKAQQMNFGISQISQNISDSNKTQIETQTTRNALNLFKSRAAIIAETMNGKYKILQMTISQNNEYIQPVMFRAKMATANALQMDSATGESSPLEIGETEISTRIEGTIIIF